jgi:hypothetical protein
MSVCVWGGGEGVRLVARSPRLLLVPSSRAVGILVELVNALPGSCVFETQARGR